MLIKMLGVVLVMVSSTLAGFYFACKEGNRIIDLTEMRKALLILRSEIEFSLTPLPQAMQNISEKTNDPVSSLFSSFASEVQEGNHESVNEIWHKVLSAGMKKCFFSTQDMDYFYSFGKALGYLDKGMQLSNIEMTVDYIDQSIEELYGTASKNKKLYHSMGLLGGLAVCILLV